MDIRTVMATIEKRGTENGKNTFRARIRLKGARDETASFSRLTDAKKWAQSTESAIREGRYFKTSASRRHTLGEAIDRYVCEIFPQATNRKHAKNSACLVAPTIGPPLPCRRFCERDR